jgi:hypothetical protein
MDGPEYLMRYEGQTIVMASAALSPMVIELQSAWVPQNGSESFKGSALNKYPHTVFYVVMCDN